MNNGTDTTLDLRYGVKRRSSWRLPLVAFISGLSLMLIVTALALFPSQHRFKSTTTSYSVTDGKHVELKVSVTNTSGLPLKCSFQALDDKFTVIGWAEKSYPQFLDDYSDILHIRTEKLAVSASVKECRVLQK